MKTLVKPVALAALCLGLGAHAQSTRPGWGSIPYQGGVTFRVWAPNATAVHVPGVFNNWSTTATPLVKEITNGVWNGNWSGDVTIASTGQQYKYFINYTNGTVWRHDPRARSVVTAASGDNDIIYDPAAFNWNGDLTNHPAIQDLVIYELHIGDFYDPRSGQSLPGRFIDATNRLPYLQSLGVNAIEVMPIAEFPSLSDWGYDPADPFAADNHAYGGPDGFKTLVLECHKRGIAVLLDVVHNHYGPTDLDLWNFDGWSTGTGGGIYFYQSSNLCCTPYGNRPDYTTPQVRSYIQDNFTMWLSEYHLDGFRWDTPGLMMNVEGYGFLTDAQTLIVGINGMIHTNSGIISIAEDVTGDGFDGTWDLSLHNFVTPQLAATNDASRDMPTIAYAITTNTLYNFPAAFNRVNFLESHDVVGDLNSGVRLVKSIDSNTPNSYRARKLSMLGAVVTFASPGVPMFFEGQEMLESAAFDSALPVDWSKTNTYRYVVQFYRDLINLRRDTLGYTPGLEGNKVQMYLDDNVNKILTWRRWPSAATNEDVFVIANFSGTLRSNYSVQFPSTGTWYVHLNSDLTTYGPDYGNVGPTNISAQGPLATGSVTVGPYSALILSRTPHTAPQLTARTTNNVVNVSWPSTYPGWVLEATAALSPTAAWNKVPPTQYQTNGTAVSLAPTAGGPVFYRLRSVKP